MQREVTLVNVNYTRIAVMWGLKGLLNDSTLKILDIYSKEQQGQVIHRNAHSNGWSPCHFKFQENFKVPVQLYIISLT